MCSAFISDSRYSSVKAHNTGFEERFLWEGQLKVISLNFMFFPVHWSERRKEKIEAKRIAKCNYALTTQDQSCADY